MNAVNFFLTWHIMSNGNFPLVRCVQAVYWKPCSTEPVNMIMQHRHVDVRVVRLSILKTESGYNNKKRGLVKLSSEWFVTTSLNIVDTGIDAKNRRRYGLVVKWIEEQRAVDEDFEKRIEFNDESYCVLNGFASKQNYPLRGWKNLQLIIPKK